MVHLFETSRSIWAIRSVSCVWMNETNEMNRTDQMDRIDLMNKTDWRIFSISCQTRRSPS